MKEKQKRKQEFFPWIVASYLTNDFRLVVKITSKSDMFSYIIYIHEQHFL